MSSEECAMVEFTDSSSARIAMQMTTLGDAKVFELHQSADKKRKHQPTKKSVLNRVTGVREDHYNSSSCPSGSEPEEGRMRHKKNVQGYPMYHIHSGYPFQGREHPKGEKEISSAVRSCPSCFLYELF